MPSNHSCPPADSLLDMLDGKLSGVLQKETETHVDQCTQCQSRIDGLLCRDLDHCLHWDRVGEALLASPSDQDIALQNAIAKLKTQPAECQTRADRIATDISLDFLNDSDVADSLGRVDAYEILEVIGRGGMGIVLKAHDTKLNRTVALKVLAPELASNATARKRFIREAQAAAAVSHDHVVTIHAVDQDRLPYLVMECIDGQSLQEKIDADGQLPLKEILRIGMQIASGLAAAHKQGLIHRDIKPANILLENSVERVRITDFGLARAADDVGMTRTGEVTGTPQYMSPEQALGQSIDHRSDLFSLGSVLYAMCTGRSPFRADSTMAAIRRVCDDAPRPIREINPDIPLWLIEIIERLLEKQPANRFQSSAEVGELLSENLARVQHPSASLPVTTKTAPQQNGKPLRRRWLFSTVVLLLILLAGFSLTEATGITKVVHSVFEIWTPRGTLIVEVDDPNLSITVDRDVKELTVSDDTHHIFTLRPGEHQVQVSRNGKPVKTELVTITRGGRRVVKVSLEGKGGPMKSTINSSNEIVEVDAFVVIGKEGGELIFDTLAEAVAGSSYGDTIEIRGNGPFITGPIEIDHALIIRAGENYRPVIKNRPWNPGERRHLLSTQYPLVLEGLEFINERPKQPDTKWPPTFSCAGSSLRICNCRLMKRWLPASSNDSVGGQFENLSQNAVLRNCELLVPNGSLMGWHCLPEGKLLVENCILSGGPLGVLPQSYGSLPASVQVKRSTFSSPIGNVRFIFSANRTAANDPAKCIDFHAGECVFDHQNAVLMTLKLAPAQARESLRQLASWSDDGNLFAVAEDLAGSHSDYSSKPPHTTVVKYDRGLESWKRYWNQPEAKVLEGTPRFVSGILAPKRGDPKQLSPEDFRLHNDSPGYRTGPDGKDIGADVDLVGPGKAYQRWKATPEYQEWLKDTKPLMAKASPETKTQIEIENKAKENRPSAEKGNLPETISPSTDR